MRFLIRHWPDGVVVFDRRFGDTHALNHLTASVFQLALRDQAGGLEDIAARLAGEFPAYASADFSLAVGLAFEQLVSRRLIQGQS